MERFWLQDFLSALRDDPVRVFLQVSIDAVVALIVFALFWVLVSRWIRGAHQDIATRELWTAERKQNEHERYKVIERYARNTVVALAVLIFLGLLGLRYEIPLLYEMALNVRTWLVSGGFGRLFAIFIAFMAANALLKVVRKATQVIAPTGGQRFERQVARATTIRSVVDSSLQVLVFTILVIFALGQLGADIGALIAGVGILGLAISFGAQSLVRDLISGFFILMEDQYGVGDIVNIAGLGGLVESLSLRITTLRDIEGNVHIIPNGQIEKATVMSKEWSRSVMDVDVAYRTDLARALEVYRDEAERMYEDEAWHWRIMDKPELLGVERLGDSGITLRLLFKTLPREQWNVSREFRKRIKARFDAEGIEIPFPHLTMYWGEKQMPDLAHPSQPQAQERV